MIGPWGLGRKDRTVKNGRKKTAHNAISYIMIVGLVCVGIIYGVTIIGEVASTGMQSVADTMSGK